MATARREFNVEVNEEDGGYWARVLELPGCFATGEDLEELREALQEAISLYLHDDPEAGAINHPLEGPEPEHMSVGGMKVAVPA